MADTSSPTPPPLPKATDLTVEQKAALSIGAGTWTTTAIPEHGVESITVADGPHGLRVPLPGDLLEMTGAEPATCFPTASALGSSWDPELAHEVAVAIADEARALDVAVVLGPGVNIKRSPLCGRNFEYLSEDPHHAGRMAAPMVAGLQSRDVGASLKHFAANNQESDRMRVSADVDARTLREIYLPAFEHVVTTQQPWTVMCSYNKVNGTYASEHHWLLTDVLRGEWGFDGLVVSDWGAVHDRAAALAAGLDLEMPPDLGVSDRRVVEGVRDGSVEESVLDATAARVLDLVGRARHRAPAEQSIAELTDAHHALARRAAAESAVLLVNNGDLLPLADRPGRRVAVIGEFARTPRYQGAGSSRVSPTRLDSPLDELDAALPASTVRFAPGFAIDAAGSEADPADLVADALNAAENADVVVAFLGLPGSAESEGYDRDHIDLPADQTDLLALLAGTGVPIVVVLANGSAVRIAPWQHHATAILECWLSGQAAGGAIADVLTGAVAPTGRLAETIPLRLEDNPSYLNFPGEDGHVRYGEGVFVGYRGYDALDREVSFPFGHGLTYTSFAYSGLAVHTAGSHDSGDLAITVSCRITNTGARDGREVVQLYVGDPESSVARPPRELKGFAKPSLRAGESQEITFTLTARDLSYWSERDGGWRLEGGEFEIAVGASSRDLRQRRLITVAATPPMRPLDRMSTVQECFAQPRAAAQLLAVAAAAYGVEPGTLAANPGLLREVADMPISVLALFAGGGITHEMVEQITGG
ncbi:glycoside hydrolase family 3 C-terminal domain-containing protein [Pseudonocardia sp. GCM10023141]|uniref:glycoside hydrolase family 3 C-terminal domain-containing protein n=1 Tax=Pseudonocardia sp. GCM10023141 TaxID=3252653 RepID=UPI00362121BD